MLSITRRQALHAAGYLALGGSTVADFCHLAHAYTPLDLAGTDQNLHLLRRISFGPTAQELARVRMIGRQAYIEEQLLAHDAEADNHAGLLFPRINDKIMVTLIATGFGFAPGAYQNDLQSAKIYRALMSKSQLREVMVDFWNDHFTTYIRKSSVPFIVDYDRDVIRQHAMGDFRTLLRAVCFSACMQRYLDNCQNVVGGINENYARELMELHTLGQGSGYSENDVKALAILLSGLDLQDAALNYNELVRYGGVVFNAAQHDPSPVTFLGHYVPGGNTIDRAETALTILLDHPATARFLAKKLCQRFVAENPSSGIVAAVANAYTSTRGDIKSMLRLMLNSSLFQQSIGAKFKRPFHAVAGAMRAAGMNVYDATLNYSPLFPTSSFVYQGIVTAGQEPYGWVSPDGYPDRKAYWDNTNTLLALQKFYVKLSQSNDYGRLLQNPATVTSGFWVSTTVAQATTARAAASNIVANLLFRPLPDAALNVLVNLIAAGANPDAPLGIDKIQRGAAGAMLAILSSPWFMVR